MYKEHMVLHNAGPIRDAATANAAAVVAIRNSTRGAANNNAHQRSPALLVRSNRKHVLLKNMHKNKGKEASS